MDVFLFQWISYYNTNWNQYMIFSSHTRQIYSPPLSPVALMCLKILCLIGTSKIL